MNKDTTILPLTTLNAVVNVLFRGKSRPEIQEAEFTPFDLSYLEDLPRESSSRSGPTKPSPAAVYPSPVPFNSPQI
jgi:hypothetical protein